MNAAHSASGHDLTPLSDAEKQQRAEHLTDEEKRILLNQGTEPPFCGGLLDNKEDGAYHCKLCDLPLFAANAKFESGTGWPSFYQAHRQGIRDAGGRQQAMGYPHRGAQPLRRFPPGPCVQRRPRAHRPALVP